MASRLIKTVRYGVCSVKIYEREHDYLVLAKGPMGKVFPGSAEASTRKAARKAAAATVRYLRKRKRRECR